MLDPLYSLSRLGLRLGNGRRGGRRCRCRLGRRGIPRVNRPCRLLLRRRHLVTGLAFRHLLGFLRLECLLHRLLRLQLGLKRTSHRHVTLHTRANSLRLRRTGRGLLLSPHCALPSRFSLGFVD